MTRIGATATGIWLLVDLFRVWTPSLITLVGQAAETPPEFIGLFALGCVGLPIIVLLGLRNHPAAHVRALHISMAIAVGCRIALQFGAGGTVQVVFSTLGVISILVWLAMTAVTLGDVLAVGTAAGLAISTVTHAALGTWGAVWRLDVWGWSLLVIQIIAVIGCHRHPISIHRSSTRTAWLLMPVMLLAGIVTANAGRASAVAGGWGLVCISIGAVLAVFAAVTPIRPWLVWIAGAVFIGCIATALLVTADVNGVSHSSPPLSVPLYALGAPALLYIFAATNSSSGRATTISVEIGALIWVCLFFMYYAGYDLGYRADLAMIGLGCVIALIAAVGSGTTEAHALLHWPSSGRWLAGLMAAAIAASALGPVVTVRPIPVHDAAGGAADSIRVGAYNVQMGYAMDGTFQPDHIARMVADTDVAMMSEVDRGWLLNGGQDQLAILSRLLGRDAVFGPAADPVWGDAIVTRLPVESRSGYPLPRHGSVTGAQALAVQLRWHEEPVWAVSTHLQPRDGQEDVLAQARDLARLMSPMIADDAATFLGGDLNTRPRSDAIKALSDVGLYATTPAEKRLATWPAKNPDRQLDHILATDDFSSAHTHVEKSNASDHLPIFTRLTLK